MRTHDRYGVAMERIGVRELRSELSGFVKRAGAGERIVITIDGQPVAQLGPLEAAVDELTIDDLAAKGLITPARRADRPEPDFVMPMWAGVRLDNLVREVRGR